MRAAVSPVVRPPTRSRTVEARFEAPPASTPEEPRTVCPPVPLEPDRSRPSNRPFIDLNNLTSGTLVVEKARAMAIGASRNDRPLTTCPPYWNRLNPRGARRTTGPQNFLRTSGSCANRVRTVVPMPLGIPWDWSHFPPVSTIPEIDGLRFQGPVWRISVFSPAPREGRECCGPRVQEPTGSTT